MSLVLVLFSVIGFSQQKISSTNQFSIDFDNETLYAVSLDQISSLPSKSIGDISTVNHKGEVKGGRQNVKGVLLKDLLGKVNLGLSKPKDLFKYYFVLEASDNYKAVLSYNEIFDTDNIYVITESDGVVIQKSKDRIEILSLSRLGQGHIYIKGLMKLELKAAD